jgi:demethylmenaquinone methyltransferase/2-methoxy-6-polyprenyl-1,4-benzoquinol methylase
VAYYRAVAREYDDHALPDVEDAAAEVAAALDRFGPAGSVLELACGPGRWTVQLLRYATSLTAIDAAPEMLEIAASRVRDVRARLVESNIFEWTPDQRYDVVFFGFWLSHVPTERFETFWQLVGASLAEDGRVFFVDDSYRTADELVDGPDSSTIRRRLNDGSEYRIVKVPHDPPHLAGQLDRLGWSITLTQSSGPIFWGSGTRRSP